MNQQCGIGPSRRDCLLAAFGLLAGCGGVDSGGTGTGVSATLAVGPINGFGSIIVNGLRFDDSVAQISDDAGRALTRADLKLGMRAAVIGSTPPGPGTTATASAVRIRSELLGPIDSIDLPAGHLMVLGQAVQIAATTVLEPGAAPLAPGDIVEVHATLDVARSLYVASRIERATAADTYKLRGVIAELDLSGRSVRVGTLRIDWSAAAPADPATALAPGRLLRIVLATTPAVGTRRALAIAADTIPLDDRDRVEIEGRITAFTSLTEFVLDGVPVDARGATFEGGAAGVVLGAKVEVEGSLRGGVLRATKVEVEDDEGDAQSFELHGSIESADAAAMRFVVRGVTVVWSTVTRFDSSGPADIVVGREVEVRGRLSADGQFVDATLIHVEG